MKIELGKKPTQKMPVSDDPVEEEMRIIYKNETGNTALYKRNGKWNESKKFKDWKSVQLSKLHEEVQEKEMPLQRITAEQLANKNLLKIMGLTEEMKQYKKQLKKKPKDPLDVYTDVNECMECGLRKMINSGTGCCEKCDDKTTKKSRELAKTNEEVALYDKNMQRRCLFLWNLMSNKMDFAETPNSKEIKELEEIQESLKYWLEEEE